MYLVGFLVGLSFTDWSSFFVSTYGPSMVGLGDSLWTPWDVFIVPKDEGSLGLIDTATQGSILAAKWVVQYLEGCSPWKVLLRHHLLTA
jgi:hypothetical protein